MKSEEKDEGQALAVSALTFFLLACFVAFVFNVGQASSQTLELQQAADAGAVAGAVSLADTLSEIAWLNDAQACLYYHALRHVVDVVTYGTLAELAEQGPPYPGGAVVGIPNAVASYDAAYTEAALWLPRLSEWSFRLGQMSWGLAALGPRLARREVFRAIHDSLGVNPVDGHTDIQIAVFPDFTLLPDPNNYYRLDITRYARNPAGWRLEDSAGFWVEVLITDPVNYEWSVTSSTGLDLQVSHPTPERYVLTASSFGTMMFDFYPGLGWVLQMPGFSMSPGPNGGILIQGPGGSGEFRRGPDGQLQQWSGGGWQDLPGSDSVTVDGVSIPIAQNGIQIGPDTWVDFNPLRIRFQNIEIHLLAGQVRIQGQFGPAWVTADDDYVVANTLSTQTADGVWRRWGDDRTRHRMRTGALSDTWIYEWKRIGSYLANERNGRRFGLANAIAKHDPGGISPPPAWAYDLIANPEGWMNPATGRLVAPKAYHQTRPCWHPLDAVCPLHGAGCPGNPLGSLLPPLDGGWHDPLTGLWVSCPICNRPDAGDFLDDDGDGLSDVRKYAADAFGRKAPPQSDLMEARLANFHDLLNTLQVWETRIVRLLVLTEDFFKYGVNVAVWKRADSDAGRAGQEFRLYGNLFPLPPGFTGRVAFASAKCGPVDPATGVVVYRFDGVDVADRASARQLWVGEHPDNLQVADWRARLWSVRDAIRDEDLDETEGLEAYAGDSGLQFLFRGLLSTEWHTRYDDVQPVWGLPGGMGLDLLDPNLRDVIRH